MQSARDRKIAPTAIAGVIAYEALENVEWSNFGGLTRSVGVGKVHYKDSYFSEGQPAAREVEEMGLLPRRTMWEREAVLSLDRGAIQYIAAIMGAQSDIAEGSNYELRCDPALLATLYDGYSLAEAHSLFARKHYPESLVPSRVGSWVARNAAYLEASLGEGQIRPTKCDVYVNGDRGP